VKLWLNHTSGLLAAIIPPPTDFRRPYIQNNRYMEHNFTGYENEDPEGSGSVTLKIISINSEWVLN